MAEAKEPFSSLLSSALHPAACIVKGKKLFDAGNLALKIRSKHRSQTRHSSLRKSNQKSSHRLRICHLQTASTPYLRFIQRLGHRRAWAVRIANLKKYLALHMMIAYLISYDWESAFIWGKRTIALARTGSHEDRARVQAGQSKIWFRPLYRTLLWHTYWATGLRRSNYCKAFHVLSKDIVRRVITSSEAGRESAALQGFVKLLFAGRKTLDLMLSEVDHAEGLAEGDSSWENTGTTLVIAQSLVGCWP